MTIEAVAIFWDYENCAAATQYTGYEIVKRIRHVAHCFGTIKSFKAYLELSDPAVSSKSLVLRSELQSSGVSLTDCPHNGRKDVADKMILVDMLAYAIDNPPPSTIILISGDRDFAYAVSILRLRRYRVVIISLPGVHTSLKTQASIFLDWNNDVLGADVVDECWSLHESPVSLQEEDRNASDSQVPRERSNSNLSSSLRRTGRSTGEHDVDIMDHLHCKDNNTTRHSGLPVSRASQGISNPALSYPQPATLTSHKAEDSPPTTRSLFKTRSIPASLLTDEKSSTPTVVSKPSPSEDEVESSAGEFNPYVSTPEVQSPVQKTWDATGNTLPLSVLLGQDLITGANQKNLSNSETTSNAVLTPPLRQPLITPIPITQFHTDGEESPTVKAFTTLPTTLLAQQSQPKVVPAQFNLLVRRLEFHRSKGFPRPFRSGIALELASNDHMVYRRAGTERFGQYVALAEKAGIIELGGKEGSAWIALRPEWYNAKIG
ncbi:hypothetical protein C0992_010692 [Termitomyces sp. T32_za158]|nr:hypothetical protein C0992_010692 [Termitomyces sp. T32_za158]